MPTNRRLTKYAALLALTAAVARAQVDEHELKAAFVFNFVSFVTWPEDHPDKEGRTYLCVRSGAAVQQALAGLHGKPLADGVLVVRMLASAGELAGCHIVVTDAPLPEATVRWHTVETVSSESDNESPWPSGWWRRHGVLSVFDGDDHGGAGAAISLVVDGTRVRFDIDRDVAHAAGLSLSSRLLRLARKVK